MSNFPNVVLVKFPKLDEVDQALFDSTVSRFFKRVGDDAKLHLSVKQYSRGGLRTQHEVHARVFINGRDFFASFKGWMLMDVLQRTLKRLEKEVDKAFSKRD